MISVPQISISISISISINQSLPSYSVEYPHCQVPCNQERLRCTNSWVACLCHTNQPVDWSRLSVLPLVGRNSPRQIRTEPPSKTPRVSLNSIHPTTLLRSYSASTLPVSCCLSSCLFLCTYIFPHYYIWTIAGFHLHKQSESICTPDTNDSPLSCLPQQSRESASGLSLHKTPHRKSFCVDFVNLRASDRASTYFPTDSSTTPIHAFSTSTPLRCHQLPTRSQ